MGKATRALVESVECRRLLASVSGMAWNDLNNDGVKQTREKWFSLDGTTSAAITLYADLNGNGALDTGEPTHTLTKEGSYSLEVGRTGPLAIRMTYAIDTAKQTAAAVFAEVPVVIINSSSDKLTNTNVPMLKGAVISGTLFNDENGNGKLDGVEVKRGQANVFYDGNGNGVRENEEPFVPIVQRGTDFKFQISVPAGEGSIVCNRWYDAGDGLTIEPITFNAEVGKHQTKDFALIAKMELNGRIFMDVNGNGKRNSGEAYTGGVRAWLDFNNNNKWDKDSEPSATSDSSGNYRIISHRTGGIYGVNIKFRSSADNVIASTSNLSRIIFKSLNDTQTFNFGFKPAAARIQVIRDLNGDKALSAGESVLQGVVAFIDKNGNKAKNSGETALTTDANGYVNFDGLELNKEYTIIVRYSSKNVATTTSPIKVTLFHSLEVRNFVFGLKPA